MGKKQNRVGRPEFTDRKDIKQRVVIFIKEKVIEANGGLKQLQKTISDQYNG